MFSSTPEARPRHLERRVLRDGGPDDHVGRTADDHRDHRPVHDHRDRTADDDHDPAGHDGVHGSVDDDGEGPDAGPRGDRNGAVRDVARRGGRGPTDTLPRTGSAADLLSVLGAGQTLSGLVMLGAGRPRRPATTA